MQWSTNTLDSIQQLYEINVAFTWCLEYLERLQLEKLSINCLCMVYI